MTSPPSNPADPGLPSATSGSIEALPSTGRRHNDPRATYRIQFHREFGFRDAEAIVPYLSKLGVSHLYASPIFKANPGSMHGYDIVDFGHLNPEVGSREEFNSLSDILKRHGMGLILDFVPNHMGIGSGQNQWWQDVLEHGRFSRFVDSFDIDWEPSKPELRDQVLLPILGDHYGVVLEDGELQVSFEEGIFTLRYFETPLPIDPVTYPVVLAVALEKLNGTLSFEDGALLEFKSILSSFERLPTGRTIDAKLIDERTREQGIAKRRLAELSSANPEIERSIKEALEALNGKPDEPSSFDNLDLLLGLQPYRLSFWRVAAEEINYRRFFAINELAAIRQEVPAVFESTHALLMELIAEGRVDGLRIDHPDGLWDPAGYYRQLQHAAYAARTGLDIEIAPVRQPDSMADGINGPDLTDPLPIYTVIEKILEPGESLPTDWAVDGTVGYEFSRIVGGLMVDGDNRKAFADLYARFTGKSISFHDLVYQSKMMIMRVALPSEVNVLALTLDRLSEHHRRTRDFTFNGLRSAMRSIIASFPVYRSYIDEWSNGPSERDRRLIERAVADAIKRNPGTDPGVFSFIGELLVLRHSSYLTDEQWAEHRKFVMKFQQLTGPVMAKGLEDTVFYLDVRLSSLNEVGGDPSSFGSKISEFHRECASRQKEWPLAMLCSSTHDTKRSEDVRARISVLSEFPKEWRLAVNRWARTNRKFKTRVDGVLYPDRNDEYLFYQTLLGTWSVGATRADETYVERICEYMLKSIHEAQAHSSWIHPNQRYDEATIAFVRAVLSADNPVFLDDMQKLNKRCARVGIINSLSMQLLKLTAPGVPDIYQGTELWDDSLVDPDNRRPVDFVRRVSLLDQLSALKPETALANSLLEDWSDGQIKLWLTHRVMVARRNDPHSFTHGEYIPLSVSGKYSECVVAFVRRYESRTWLAVAPRLTARITETRDEWPIADLWGDTAITLPSWLSDAHFRCVLSGIEVGTAGGRTMGIAELLGALPVALLQTMDKDQ